MYTCPFNNVRYNLEELTTKQLVGASQVGSTVNTASLPLPIADHIGVHDCTTSSSGSTNGFMSTMGDLEGVFFCRFHAITINSWQYFHNLNIEECNNLNNHPITPEIDDTLSQYVPKV